MDDNGVVEISGTVDPSLLLQMLGKAGRKAELLWLQFGECSSNLFIPTNHNAYGGTTYSRDGRYLHAVNLPRPKLPSHEALMSSAHNQKNDYQIAYDQINGYDQYAHSHNYHYQQSYDQKHDYQQDYYRDHGYHYQHSNDHGNDYQHYDCGNGHCYSSGYRHDGKQTQYRHSLQTVGGEDMGCCRVM